MVTKIFCTFGKNIMNHENEKGTQSIPVVEVVFTIPGVQGVLKYPFKVLQF